MIEPTYTMWCDHRDTETGDVCPRWIGQGDKDEVKAQAIGAGWLVRQGKHSGRDYCPEHRGTHARRTTPLEGVPGNIYRARRARQMSQAALAKAMADNGFQVYQTTVSRWEGGLQPLKVDELRALARILGPQVAANTELEGTS